MRRKQIVIADDHAIVRSGVSGLVEARDDWEIVGEASDGKEAINLIVEKKPDLAILDYSLPMIDGLEVTRSIKARQLSVEILIFTMHDSDALAGECFRAGAKAFLLKSEPKQRLTSAIETLLLHKPFLTGPIAERFMTNCFSTNPADGKQEITLSPRERMVVQLITEGYSNKGMSRVLNLSVKTIETHRASAMQKLEVRSTAALVRYAIKNLFIQP